LAQLNPNDAQKYSGFKPQYTGIDGSMITSAARSADQNTGLPIVTFSLNSQGASKFCTLTQALVAKGVGTTEHHIAIFLDQDLLPDAQVTDAICGGSGEISGGVTVEGANELSGQI